MEFNYDDTIKELREFSNLNLENMTDLEIGLKEADTEDLIRLYKALEETRQHLLKVQSML